jgi:hypothetical protein
MVTFQQRNVLRLFRIHLEPSRIATALRISDEHLQREITLLQEHYKKACVPELIEAAITAGDIEKSVTIVNFRTITADRKQKKLLLVIANLLCLGRTRSWIEEYVQLSRNTVERRIGQLYGFAGVSNLQDFVVIYETWRSAVR